MFSFALDTQRLPELPSKGCAPSRTVQPRAQAAPSSPHPPLLGWVVGDFVQGSNQSRSQLGVTQPRRARLGMTLPYVQTFPHHLSLTSTSPALALLPAILVLFLVWFRRGPLPGVVLSMVLNHQVRAV